MTVRNVLFALVLSVLTSLALAAVSLLYQESVQMIDYSAVRYGFPCYYIEHVTVTFAGITNRWFFIGQNLALDIDLYFLIGLGLWSAILLISSNRLSARSTENSNNR
jgi:hypothetical protein